MNWQLPPEVFWLSTLRDVSLKDLSECNLLYFPQPNYCTGICWEKPAPPLSHTPPSCWHPPPFLFLLKELAHKLLTIAAGHTDLDPECLIQSSAVTCAGAKGRSLRESSHSHSTLSITLNECANMYRLHSWEFYKAAFIFLTMKNSLVLGNRHIA